MSAAETVPTTPALGLHAQFAPGDREAVETAAAALKRLGVRELRLDPGTGDDKWTGWLLARLASEFGVVVAAEPSRAIEIAEAHGPLMRWVELPLDNAAAPAVQRCRQLGVRVVLRGPTDPERLERLAGLPAKADALLLEGPAEEGWAATAALCRNVLQRQGALGQIWIEVAPPARRNPVRALMDALAAPVDRVYWAQPLHAVEPAPLLARLLEAGGIAAVREFDRVARPAPALLRGGGATDRPVLLTGGAGFIGTNLADRLARDGQRVLILDSLARPGVEQNLAWLKAQHGDAVSVELGDLRDEAVVGHVVAQASAVYHFAAQVAVTTSLVDPLDDFETNARGTILLLEALRARKEPVPLIFTSTNKVYGKLGDVALEEAGERWQPADPALREHGIAEDRPLDFYSPYGCSKGAADQYVLDYARTYGLPAAVFRMSCIYGPHQFGTEDQGWVAHFLISALSGRPITLYGDGKQVRDILHVDDLVRALKLARERMDAIAGQAFNIGGGPGNAVSLLELLSRIAAQTGTRPEIGFGAWRPGDQLYYVSDTTRFREATGWRPRLSVDAGLADLAAWLSEFRLPGLRQAAPRRAAS
ncbi:NAD-dependent epimerase/dehydratase family protein [Arenibaculum pallidiluteum]|uniref:NAD-dependent epimerase/dehydratase family protein n=1 Tax=Arenibaculum pallidiluteum TaxID=2812559 RepID=UPI001F2A2E54|nr:NAD-dependent epimerase/dehydratase family protein [Arenibaculum pallidiluteum]